MPAIVSVEAVRKTYASGFEALKGVSLAIEEGEILALLGPNGAGKTTLISAICGITVPTSGRITVGGHDAVTDFRRSRKLIGLVPQEVTLEPFATVLNTVRFTRGLFGRRSDDAYLEKVLRQLSLWDKRDTQTRELSGGMKRRVLIAKALSHQPRILFLDEPTAGVDVELRKSTVGGGRRAPRRRHHHHPHHPLHRGGRGHRRPHRRDQRRPDPPRRGQGQADAAHGPEADDDRAAGAGRRPSPTRSPPTT